MMDSTGEYCAEGQSGPVWYVIWDTGGNDVRNCTVPAGKAILISPAEIECSVADEGIGSTFADLRSCAKGVMDPVTADVTVDGVHLTNLLTRYRFESPLFTFKYPADSLFDVPGPGTTKAVLDAILVILAPLAAGRHTLDLRFNWNQDEPPYPPGNVTYHLTVGS
jgi:hypothetical protein